MTMESLHLKLDELLRLNGHEVLGGWQDYLKEEALRHTEVEYEIYKKRIKIESLGGMMKRHWLRESMVICL